MLVDISAPRDLRSHQAGPLARRTRTQHLAGHREIDPSSRHRTARCRRRRFASRSEFGRAIAVAGWSGGLTTLVCLREFVRSTSTPATGPRAMFHGISEGRIRLRLASRRDSRSARFRWQHHWWRATEAMSFRQFIEVRDSGGGRTMYRQPRPCETDATAPMDPRTCSSPRLPIIAI